MSYNIEWNDGILWNEIKPIYNGYIPSYILDTEKRRRFCYVNKRKYEIIEILNKIPDISYYEYTNIRKKIMN